MLPPPITRPTPAPILEMSLISVASRLRISKSKPVPFCPARASPDSLRRTRLYLRSGNDERVEVVSNCNRMGASSEQRGSRLSVHNVGTSSSAIHATSSRTHATEVHHGVVNYELTATPLT